MASFGKHDLKYQYSWIRTEGDSKVTGFPDNIFLNRSEGFEVLHFLNKYMTDRRLTTLQDFRTLERSIKNDVPSNYHSHAHIKDWLDKNVR
ncbi:MAG: hypothetical protein EOP48_13850 [Sphingobacteriales bacterium]|nr:MAG: hypothetical protein EOP48_13850 [Sphingobacteriales bacterium]